jgi:hypothetical protein
VLDVICALAQPVFDAIIDERETFGTWDPVRRQYADLLWRPTRSVLLPPTPLEDASQR